MQSLYYSALFASSIFFSMLQVTSAFPLAQNSQPAGGTIDLTAIEPIFATATPTLVASIDTPLPQPTVFTTLFRPATTPTQPSAIYTPPPQLEISAPIISQPPLTTPIATRTATAFTSRSEPAFLTPTPLPPAPVLTTLPQPTFVSLASTPVAEIFPRYTQTSLGW